MKTTPVLKTVAAATLLALSSSAFAERMIVHHDASDNGLKKGHSVLVQGNGWFAVDLDENGKSAIRGKKGFKFMEVDQKRYPMAAFNDSPGDPNSVQVSPYNYFQIEADQLNYQGGIKVCVIDSGLALTTGATGGPNLDFDTSVITGDNDSVSGSWNQDGGPHGTHVAGTIGAADNGFGVIGMAPGVAMHIIKVFDWDAAQNNSVWAYSSTLAAAANKCADAGANIINMSLGGPGSSNAERDAFAALNDAGILSVAAAGNDGNNQPSYPAAYSSVMMIGGVDNDNAKYSGSQYPTCATSGRGKNRQTDEGTCVEVSAGAVGVLSTVPSGTARLSSLTADGAAFASSSMENSGSASGSTYFMGTAEATDSGANGKICVIDRGNISFHDKVQNCENSGGLGAIIINNEAGMLFGTLGSPNNTSIPAVGTALEDRSALLAASTASISIVDGDYDYFTGTSMATPTVAGAAALIWSNHPSCSNDDIRSALKATAQDIGDAGRDVHFGYGIAKAKAASDYLASAGCGGTEPPTGDPTLSGNRSKGGRQANLSWSGLNGNDVDVFIDGNYNNTTANDGSASYSVTKGVSYTFQVCEAGTSTCTNTITL